MAESSWPYDSGPGSDTREDRWRDMARQWVAGGDGVLAGELDELLCYADSTGLQVKLKAGRAWVRGAHYLRDAEAVLAIAANASGSTRIDRVVLRNDFTGNSTTAVVITGTPGGPAPSLVRTATSWDIPLAQVSIPSADATIDAGQVTDERPIIGPLGSGLSVPSQAVRDLMIPAPFAGARVYRRDRAGLDIVVGTVWRPAGSAGLAARRAAAQTFTSGSAQSMIWDTEDSDLDGYLTAPSSAVVIPTGLGGRHTVTVAIACAVGPITTAIVSINSVIYPLATSASGGQGLAAGSFSVDLPASTPIVTTVTQASGASQSVTGSITVTRHGV